MIITGYVRFIILTLLGLPCLILALIHKYKLKKKLLRPIKYIPLKDFICLH